VCASSLSLMDAGVPLREHVAGIAMGLIYENGTYTALTDILGSEDAFGDMDFKVAGTADVVTALQLDTKIDGLPADVLAAALDQAKEARLAILEVMKQAIPEPRPEVQGTAPKIISFPIPLDRIGEVIGPKGKVINTIQQDTGADIAVDDDGVVGTVTIGSKDGTAVEEARRTIELILNPPSVELGTVYKGKVVNITKFGAFVNILPGRDGLVHISKLGGGKRIDKVEDVVSLGDEIDVLVEDIDPNGKVSLRPQGEGFDIPEGAESAPRERRERAPREDRAPREPRGDSDGGGAKTVSFEDEFEAELKSEFGDLGPGGAPAAGGGDTRSSDRDRNRRPRGGRR
jgi:polyribonucleotide nucleotidyltransferase